MGQQRVIVIKMSELKALPGAASGSPKAQRSYGPDKHVVLIHGELAALHEDRLARFGAGSLCH